MLKFWRVATGWSRRRKLIIAVAVCVPLLLFWFCLPDPLFDSPTSHVIDDGKGELLGASIAADGQWRFPYNTQVPEKFKACIIAFEDHRFYNHPGVDLLALARAMRQNLRAGRVTSGGSTISMQVVRLATRRKRTVWNKLREMVMATRLELGYSKDEILALYASNAPFGSNVVGLDAASWRYFGRTPSALSWGEMAALAVLPNSPSLVHPGRNRNTLLRKRNQLLARLAVQGVIDTTTASLAQLEPMPDRPLALPRKAPHLLQRFRKENPAGKETRITTTIQAALQQQVADILERHHQQLKANGINNMAAIVLDVESGATLAYAGNIYHPSDPALESDVDVIAAPRSPGSILKPLLYATMMNDGYLLPDALVADVPTQIAGYHPENFDLGYDGAIPASRALARSLNVPAVKMLQKYKYERFYDFLKKTGFTTLKQPADFYGLSLILGGSENTLWELAGAYAGMARVLNHYHIYKGGYDPGDFHPPVYASSISKDPKIEKSGLLGAGSIWFTLQAMEEVMRPGEEMLWQQFASTQRIAWKTGTSFGFRDGWAIGITPRFVVGVWAGNTTGEGRPGLTGINSAAPAMFEIFRALPVARAWFDRPAGDMVNIKVCRESGFRAGEYCDHAEDRWVPLPGLKSPVCAWHQLVHLDQTGRFQVTAECVSPADMIHRSWFVLPPAMEHYYRTKNYQYKTLPPFMPGCEDMPAVAQMELIYPKAGAKIYIPIEADGQRGRVIGNAAHRNTDARIFWHLDKHYIGQTRGAHQMELQPSPGTHVITLTDDNGNETSVKIEVLSKED